MIEHIMIDVKKSFQIDEKIHSKPVQSLLELFSDFIEMICTERFELNQVKSEMVQTITDKMEEVNSNSIKPQETKRSFSFTLFGSSPKKNNQ